MILAWNMIIYNSPESKSNIIESSIYMQIQREFIVYMQIQREFRFCIAVTSPVQGTIRAAGIDGRQRTAFISSVREQPPHNQ
jgi:hypothetical protein